MKLKFNSIALNLACSGLRDSRVRNQEGVNKSETVSIVFIATDFLDSWIYNFFLADRLSRLCLALKCSAFAYTKLTTLPYLKYPVKLHVGSTTQGSAASKSSKDSKMNRM